MDTEKLGIIGSIGALVGLRLPAATLVGLRHPIQESDHGLVMLSTVNNVEIIGVIDVIALS